MKARDLRQKILQQRFPIEKITPPENPVSFSKDALLDLANTIELLGFTVDPIILEENEDKAEFKIVKGEFQYQAAVICKNMTGNSHMTINAIVIPNDAKIKKAFNEALDEQINILQKEISP